MKNSVHSVVLNIFDLTQPTVMPTCLWLHARFVEKLALNLHGLGNLHYLEADIKILTYFTTNRIPFAT